MFSPLVSSHWIPDNADISTPTEGRVLVAVDPSLPTNRPVTLLHTETNQAILRLTPARTRDLHVTDGELLDEPDVRARIANSGMSLTDPDHIFFLSLEEQATLQAEEHSAHTRQLTERDAAAFAAFATAAPAEELDEAYVELDHWLVFGTFVGDALAAVGDALAAVASMYPWRGTKLADLGVITLPEHRGRGAARATVRAISAAALSHGYEPQYRCQLDNTASIALARASGFTLFGTWEVVDGA